MLEEKKEWQLKLDVFEGPLDLLLHLIKKLEIDIYDIPIVEITEQYMQYIHTMQTLQLDVAGEYIVMAATLMAIKSKMLLPKQEIESESIEDLYEEGTDPREALVAQLLEYRKYKYASELLEEKALERSLYYSKPPSDLDDYREKEIELEPNQVTTIDLFMAFHQILERRRKNIPREGMIESDEQTIEQKMEAIMSRLADLPEENSKIRFDSLFQSYSRNEIVTTFMALLELMKKKEVVVQQKDNYAPIFVAKYHLEKEWN